MDKWNLALASAVLAGTLVASVAEASTYTVQKGGTLFKIALAHGNRGFFEDVE